MARTCTTPRAHSLANATLGVMNGAALGVQAIGTALSQARGLSRKHAVKQVDRLLSNQGIDVWDSFAKWVPYIVGARTEVVLAMDWTDFAHDEHATIMIFMVTRHGRATPLVWRTVDKATLKDHRNFHEDAVLRRLREVLLEGTQVTVLADRGFGDQNYSILCNMNWTSTTSSAFATTPMSPTAQARNAKRRSG